MKVGSKIHNSIGISLIIVSVALAIIYWDENIVRATFYLIFAIAISVLILFLTKKRKEIEREGE